MNLLKKTGLALLCFIFVSVGCDDKGKTTYIPIGGGGHVVGDMKQIAMSELHFSLVYVPGKKFFTLTDDSGSAEVARGFWIGETEVTYQMWGMVKYWTSGLGYHFANAGTDGDNGSRTDLDPVTTVNWRDCIVWCNAATECYNNANGTSLTCVYTFNNEILRDSRDTNAAACDAAVADPNATGFRLLTGNEWELAARYRNDINNDGDIMDPLEYYPGNYASGSTSDITNTSPTGMMAWYADNSGTATHPVRQKYPNALGLYDMSGNVRELVFDRLPGYTETHHRDCGGDWNQPADFLQVGALNGIIFASEYNFVGFRIGMNE
jgi:formylglycine-generating enzyme required for sulfatase activity